MNEDLTIERATLPGRTHFPGTPTWQQRAARTTATALLAAACLSPAPVLAAVGHVAAADGEAEIGRGGVFATAEIGDAVELGDELRTGDGRLRVVFRDDSVLNLSEQTRVVVDEQVFAPDEGQFGSVLRLLHGRIRAAVSHYYGTAGSSYEVETPTAVAGVRGTTFVVGYDDEERLTEVIGVRGRVHVRGLDERLGDGVFVTAQEATTVAADGAPAPPIAIDEFLFRERLDAVEALGRGNLGGLASGGLLRGGSEVAPADRAPRAATQVTTLDDLRDASDVVGQPLPVVTTTRGRLGVPF